MQKLQTLKINKTVQNIPTKAPRTKRNQPKTQLKVTTTATKNSLDVPQNNQFVPSSLCEMHQQNQNMIFSLYHQFIQTLINNKHFLNSLFSELKFEEINSPTNTIMKPSIRSMALEKSFNGQQITSLEDFNNFMKKRISIQVIQSNLSLESLGLIHYDSQTTFQSDNLVLTKEILQQLFENPSPFIMTQSLCLLLKYLWRSKTVLTKQNCVKLVLISTMLAFKLCYDQQVEGIGWYYASIVALESKEIPRMEAKFLKQLEFETDITKNQYFIVSTHLLTK